MGQSHAKIKTADIEELAANTNFTEEEVKKWFKSFMNECPSGVLSQEDFKNFYSAFFPGGDATLFSKHAFRTFDKNGDGSMDFREFLCALSVTSRGTFDQKLRWAFSLYDADNDGYVTRKEMLEIMQAIYKLVGEKNVELVTSDGLSAQQRVDRMFDVIDKDGDQQITVEEFRIAANMDPTLVILLQSPEN